jgi:hypothetical protein
VHEFVDEVRVLSRWVGRDVSGALSGTVPGWNVFRFRDAVVFAPDDAESSGRTYLVRGEIVGEFVVSQQSIDQAYADLDGHGDLPAVA